MRPPYAVSQLPWRAGKDLLLSDWLGRNGRRTFPRDVRLLQYSLTVGSLISETAKADCQNLLWIRGERTSPRVWRPGRQHSSVPASTLNIERRSSVIGSQSDNLNADVAGQRRPATF